MHKPAMLCTKSKGKQTDITTSSFNASVTRLRFTMETDMQPTGKQKG